ncbi:MAG: glycosyltransferase, partial [Opitutae bacterium]
MLFILPSFAGGGAERVVINLLNRIHSRGVNVRLVVFNAHGPLRGLISDEVKIDELCVRSLRGSVILLIKKIREVN